jgi:hypothetical protein
MNDISTDKVNQKERVWGIGSRVQGRKKIGFEIPAVRQLPEA